MSLKRLTISLLFALFACAVQAQISAPNASSSVPTNYTDGGEQDVIFFFCGEVGNTPGELTITADEEVDFAWKKFDQSSATFVPYFSETATTSTISNLQDGCYRVSYTKADGTSFEEEAWVLLSNIDFNVSIQEFNCDYTKFGCTINSGADYTYYNLSNGSVVLMARSFTYEWFEENESVGKVQNPSVYDPPAQNSNYTCTVTDISGCAFDQLIEYISIVPSAEFSWSHNQSASGSKLQAPLEVNFNNVSQNASEYEWSLYKSREDLYEESLSGEIYDSLLTTFPEESPQYTYERSGTYDVKLVVTKTSEHFTCLDSVKLEEPIKVDTSFVSVAPVLTPNGDGINDQLIIKTVSLESLDFQVFNRWGQRVHVFKKSDFVPGDAEFAAWDGKISGKIASEGVYFYVVEAHGRDGRTRRTKGFVHLFD